MLESKTYLTQTGISIISNIEEINYKDNLGKRLIEKLNSEMGVILISNYDKYRKYSRFDIGFSNPPIIIEAIGLNFTIKSLNKRGTMILKILHEILIKKNLPEIKLEYNQLDKITGFIKKNLPLLEEDRLRQPSIISLIREIINLFYHPDEEFLGLYGALGFDLVYQFEDITMKMNRNNKRDLVLYLPDCIYVINKQNQTSKKISYDFSYSNYSTKGIVNGLCLETSSYYPNNLLENNCDHKRDEYQNNVIKLKQRFKQGDMFECVLSQKFTYNIKTQPSELFCKILKKNKSPYSLFLNLGKNEFLIGASPEMFVKVTNNRVESCPISGTIKRGNNVFEDTQNIIKLLNSKKDASELVMCTDIDRNDKSKVCVPGSIKVLTHRKIEETERLIHTVDHVEGCIKEDCDSLDALVAHLWAVTLTGSPKKIAIETIENMEKSPRQWYGGAIGVLNFNKNINTGITIRTFHIDDGLINFRVGATLLYDSDPLEEENETLLKASNFLDLLLSKSNVNNETKLQINLNKKILVIDFDDSFIYTIISYLKYLGNEVKTIRWYNDYSKLNPDSYEVVIFSPGPKHPKDYPMKEMLDFFIKLNKKIIGICLGHQAIIQYFNGSLNILDNPVHGKKTNILLKNSPEFSNVKVNNINVARYHSIYASIEGFPDILNISSVTKDNIVMSFKHKKLPIFGLQFHPESILTDQEIGYKILTNILTN